MDSIIFDHGQAQLVGSKLVFTGLKTDPISNYPTFARLGGASYFQIGNTLTPVTIPKFTPVDFSQYGSGAIVYWFGKENLTLMGSAFDDNINVNGPGPGVPTSMIDSSGLYRATIDGGLGADSIFGGYGKDVLRGGDGADKIQGNSGNDSVSGDAGNDDLSGGFGNDTLDGGLGSDILAGGDGNDRLTAGADSESNQLSGGVGDDKLYGGLGADTLNGDSGNDYLGGAAGADSLFGGDGNDSIAGGAGDDRIEGGAGNDHLDGDDGADYLLGGAGRDNMSGSAGDDTIDGGSGADLINGGTGYDTMVYDQIESNFAVKTVGQYTYVRDLTTGDVDRLAGVERLQFVEPATFAYTLDGGRLTASGKPYSGGVAISLQTGQAQSISYDDKVVDLQKRFVDTLDLRSLEVGATAEVIVSEGDPTTGNKLVLGSEFSDTIRLSGLAIGASRGVEGLGGDDYISISGGSFATNISGGEGNDTIDATSYNGGYYFNVFGDGGDDLIIFDADDHTDVVMKIFDGGDGTDTIWFKSGAIPDSGYHQFDYIEFVKIGDGPALTYAEYINTLI